MRGVLGLVVLLFGVIPAAPSLAQAPGSGDPSGLAAVGVVIPFFASAGNTSVLEVTSPVGDNAGSKPLRLVFYTADCKPYASTILPVTANGIAVLDLGQYVNFDGLLLIGAVPVRFHRPGRTDPLQNPIHAVVRWLDSKTNSWHTLSPITIANAEGAPNQTWNPLRTAATFIAPVQGSDLSQLYFLCPSNAVINEISGAPGLVPSPATRFVVRIYDDQERFLRNVHINNCSCLTPLRLTDIDQVYSQPAFTSTYYYTEIAGDSGANPPGSFTGYLRVFSGPPGEFARLQSGNWQSISGTLNTTDR